MPLQRAGAGMCARRRSTFLLRRQEKGTKEKATPLSVTPAGQPAVRASGGVRANSLHCVSLKQRASLIRLKLCSSARPEGKGSRAALRAIAALGPGVGSARGAGSGAGFSGAQALGAQCNCRITMQRSETRAQTPIPERRAQRMSFAMHV